LEKYLVYTITQDAVLVSIVLASQLIATLGAGPLIAPWADLQERRRLLILSDWVRAPIVLLIPLAATRSLGALILVVFLLELMRNLHDPVTHAAVPTLVSEQDLDSANGLILFTQRFAEVAFVGLAGILVAAVGPNPAFWIDAVSYLVSGTILLSLPGLEPGATRRNDYWSRVREGINHLVGEPVIRRTVSTLFTAAMFGSVEAVLGIVLAVSVLQVGAAGFGAMEAALALGSVLGTLVVPQLTNLVTRERLVSLGLLGFGLLETSIGVFPIFGWAMIAYFLSGLLNMIFIIPARSILQLNTPSDLRTRVFAAFGAVMNAAVLIGTSFGGLLEKAAGAPLVFVFAGLMVSFVTLLVLLRGAYRAPVTA
jgi:MFS family permease